MCVVNRVSSVLCVSSASALSVLCVRRRILSPLTARSHSPRVAADHATAASHDRQEDRRAAQHGAEGRTWLSMERTPAASEDACPRCAAARAQAQALPLSLPEKEAAVAPEEIIIGDTGDSASPPPLRSNSSRRGSMTDPSLPLHPPAPHSASRHSPSLAEVLLGRGRSASFGVGSPPATASASPQHPVSASILSPPLSSERRLSMARKRTYSFGAASTSPLVPARRLSEASDAQEGAAVPSATVPSAPTSGDATAPPAATVSRRAGRKLAFGTDQKFLLPPASPAARAYVSHGGALRPSPSPPPPALALLPLTLDSSTSTDPLPLAVQEVLLEEEEEMQDGEDDVAVIDEAGEQRQWRTLRGVWAMSSMLLGLAAKLVANMGMTTKWMRMLGRLVLFSIALAPAWVIIGRTYLTARFIKRGVRYGLNARNFLDVYLPHEVRTTSKHHQHQHSQAHGAGQQHANGKQTTQQQDSAAPCSCLCARHRAEAVAEEAQRRNVLRALPLVSRFQKQLSFVLANLGLARDAQQDIDANAALELERTDSRSSNSSSLKSTLKSAAASVGSPSSPSSASPVADQGAQFAAALASNAERPAPTFSSSPHSPRQSPTSSSCCVSPVHSSTRAPSSDTGLAPKKKLAPVVIFLTGGAWSIGYKAWGALLGLGLSAHGVLVLSVDYRNFPQTDISGMSLDVQTALTFVFRHVEAFGGDPNRIFLVGQSAGAHLGALAVLQNCEALLSGKRTSWTAHKLRGFVGVSGPYDLAHIADHLDARGLPRMVFQRMMRATGGSASAPVGNGKKSTVDEELARWSPAHLAQQKWLREHMLGPNADPLDQTHAALRGGAGLNSARDRLLPPFLLIHGKADKTVHFKETDFFARCLHAAGVVVSVRYYKNYSHTDPIIEGPLTGHDHLCHDLLAFITLQCRLHEEWVENKTRQMHGHEQEHAQGDQRGARRAASRSLFSLSPATVPRSLSGTGAGMTPIAPSVPSFSPPSFSAVVARQAEGQNKVHRPSPTKVVPTPALAMDATRAEQQQQHHLPQPLQEHGGFAQVSEVDGCISHGHHSNRHQHHRQQHQSRSRGRLSKELRRTEEVHTSPEEAKEPYQPGLPPTDPPPASPLWRRLVPSFLRSRSSKGGGPSHSRRHTRAHRSRPFRPLTRQSSHLPFPLDLVDDVNEETDEDEDGDFDTSDEEDAASDSSTSSSDEEHHRYPRCSEPDLSSSEDEAEKIKHQARMERAHLSPPLPLESPSGRPTLLSPRHRIRNDRVSFSAKKRRPGFCARAVASVVWLVTVFWHLAMWWVPRSVGHVARVAASAPLRPLVRLVRMSPPPRESDSSASPTRQPAGHTVDDAAVASRRVGEGGMDEGTRRRKRKSRRRNRANERDDGADADSSSGVSPSPRAPRRYAYPLQAASSLPRRPPRPLIPRVLIRMARYINPF